METCLLPMLYCKHPCFAHDLQLHPLQLPHVYSQFDQPQTLCLIHWYDVKDWGIMVAVDAYGPLMLYHHLS